MLIPGVVTLRPIFFARVQPLIEDGRITAPVKGTTPVGNGPEALKAEWCGVPLLIQAGSGSPGLYREDHVDLCWSG